jgi:serine/threonine protein kinase
MCAGKVIAKASLRVFAPRQARLEEEMDIHQSLSNGGSSHPHVLELLTRFQDSDHIYMVTPLCPHQDMKMLHSRRTTLTEGEVRYYMSQLLAGIEFMHSQHVVHRDLKLANLFLSTGLKLKIADFGYAIALCAPGQRRYSLCGTPNYISPEILSGRKGPGHSYEADTWAAGIVMYTLLCGTPPFQAEDGSLEGTYR